MDDKVLLYVILPSINEQLEVWVPKFLTFGVLNELIGNVANQATAGNFQSNERLLLCEEKTGRPFALSKTPQDLGLGNGFKTMLI